MEVQGDFGIHTHEQLKALSNNMLLSPSFCGGKVSPGMAAYNIHLGSSSLDPMIGVLSLAQRSQTVPPDIGWVVMHQHAGHGYATEAGKEFFKYMIEEYGVTEMVAIVKPTNVVSIKVAEKIGFVEGGGIIGEDGIPRRVFMLKGMKKIDPDTRINFHGEEGEKIKEMSTGSSGL
ncbi:putative lipase atg15 [Xylographa pallens]|nr:putative lipase atg15 [Xylographa pallens]